MKLTGACLLNRGAKVIVMTLGSKKINISGIGPYKSSKRQLIRTIPRAQTSAKAKIWRGRVLHGQETYGTTVVAAASTSIDFTRDSFLREKYIVSWFDLKTCSMIIENGAIGQNTYDFLLVFRPYLFIPFCRADNGSYIVTHDRCNPPLNWPMTRVTHDTRLS